MRTPPNSAIPHQGVEDREQLPHARHQRHLLRLARGEQPLVELLDGGVVAGGDQGTHVEGDSNRGSTAPHLPLTTPLAGIPVEGGDSHQSREALVGELAQFGQFGEERARQDRADTGNALEERLVLLEGGAPLDGLLEVGIGSLDLLLEPLHVRPDSLGESLLPRHLEAIVFGGEHREQLTPPGEYGLQSLGFRVGKGAFGEGSTARARRARTKASILSVLASLPMALAKSRACRGLTTATAIPAEAMEVAGRRS